MDNSEALNQHVLDLTFSKKVSTENISFFIGYGSVFGTLSNIFDEVFFRK